MINRLVGRCHVGESTESVIRFVISKLVNGFETFRECPTDVKAMFISNIIKAHNDNRNLFSKVSTGKF